MSANNKKEFGVWMDTHYAAVAGREQLESGAFTIIGRVRNEGPGSNSSEHASNQKEITMTQRYFKEIAALMPNVDAIHITGTGQVQEQFMKFLSETAQFKNAKTTESTSNKMSDAEFMELITNYFS